MLTVREHEMWLRMQAKSAAGRERAVEHIIGEHYIKQLIGVLNQAEDLESINDLHALCSLMQTIREFQVWVFGVGRLLTLQSCSTITVSLSTSSRMTSSWEFLECLSVGCRGFALPKLTCR